MPSGVWSAAYVLSRQRLKEKAIKKSKEAQNQVIRTKNVDRRSRVEMWLVCVLCMCSRPEDWRHTLAQGGWLCWMTWHCSAGRACPAVHGTLLAGHRTWAFLGCTWRGWWGCGLSENTLEQSKSFTKPYHSAQERLVSILDETLHVNWRETS